MKMQEKNKGMSNQNYKKKGLKVWINLHKKKAAHIKNPAVRGQLALEGDREWD